MPQRQAAAFLAPFRCVALCDIRTRGAQYSCSSVDIVALKTCKQPSTSANKCTPPLTALVITNLIPGDLCLESGQSPQLEKVLEKDIHWKLEVFLKTWMYAEIVVWGEGSNHTQGYHQASKL